MLTSRHCDNRRELVELEPPFASKAVKVLHVREDCEVGGHFHKRKHELFCLVSGSGSVTTDGQKSDLIIDEWVFIRQGVMHSFNLSKGSILIGLASMPFDKNDDYHEEDY